jgi:hypothetical protein
LIYFFAGWLFNFGEKKKGPESLDSRAPWLLFRFYPI